jgi:hypothetical protein
VGWSYFLGHGHKHADEMSVLFWAGGQTWLSNIGYWPYENESRGMIESWTGSNAPHLVKEPLDSIRSTRLVSSGSSGKLTALELERTEAENYVARRQVIQCKPDLWLVLDNTSGSEKSRTSTTWTSAPDVLWQQGQTAGAFRLTSPRVSDSLNMFFLGSENTQQSLLRGSYRPFAGWQIEHHRPTPASALVVEQPARNSWAATVWTWERKGVTARFDSAPQMTHWADATHWEMQLPNAAGAFTLRREGNRLHLHSGRDDSGRGDSAVHDEVLELTAPSPEISPALAELHNQFMASASRYPVFSVNSNKREKVTYLLLGIFLLQQIFFLAYKRMQGPHLEGLRFLNLVAWIVGGIWLTVFYF